jgi:hypothetical protein
VALETEIYFLMSGGWEDQDQGPRKFGSGKSPLPGLKMIFLSLCSHMVGKEDKREGREGVKKGKGQERKRERESSCFFLQ